MIPAKSGMFLLKFVEPQFAESTLDGNVFFKRNNYFVEQEEIELEKGIGDAREGVWTRLLTPGTKAYFIEDEEGKMHPINIKKGVYRRVYANVRKMPICCFVVLNFYLDYDVNEENGMAFLKDYINEALISQFEGRDLIFIKDGEKFLKRMDIHCYKKEIGFSRGLVKYFDDETEEHPLREEEYEDNPTVALFYKRKFFEYQKEYRCALNRFIEEDYMLQMGDIRDIAVNLGVVEKGDQLLSVATRPLVLKADI